MNLKWPTPICDSLMLNNRIGSIAQLSKISMTMFGIEFRCRCQIVMRCIMTASNNSITSFTMFNCMNRSPSMIARVISQINNLTKAMVVAHKQRTSSFGDLDFPVYASLHRKLFVVVQVQLCNCFLSSALTLLIVYLRS